MELRFRRANASDAEALSELAARLFEQTFGAANTPEDMRAYLSAAFTVDQQKAELADPDRATWFAESDEGNVVGFVMLRRGSKSDSVIAARPAEVQRLYADRTLHGRGTGARLMELCLAQASAWNCDVIWLAVWEKNPRAIAFYEKQGFRKVGRQTFRLGADVQHDDVMARNLSSSE
jgi:ribosomal protein S18 acetylase RimI-like enzyme